MYRIETYTRRTAFAIQVRSGKARTADQHHCCPLSLLRLDILLLPCWTPTDGSRHELGRLGIWYSRLVRNLLLCSSWSTCVCRASQVRSKRVIHDCWTDSVSCRIETYCSYMVRHFRHHYLHSRCLTNLDYVFTIHCMYLQ